MSAHSLDRAATRVGLVGSPTLAKLAHEMVKVTFEDVIWASAQEMRGAEREKAGDGSKPRRSLWNNISDFVHSRELTWEQISKCKIFQQLEPQHRRCGC
jgi:hypothetical protein